MCMYKDKTDGHCTYRSCAAVTEYCHDGPCDDEVQTNADRIRAMSDEELAKANVRRTQKTSDEYCWSVYITSDGEEFENYEIALKHETEWLQQPAEENKV